MPDRVLRQFGFVQKIPMAPYIPEDAFRPDSSKRYSVTYHRAVCKSMWNYNMRMDTGGLDRAVVPFQSVSDYLPWFESVSHPKFIPPEDSPSRDLDAMIDIDDVCLYLYRLGLLILFFC